MPRLHTRHDDYIKGICRALPKDAIKEHLKLLQIWSPKQATPEPGESLFKWIASAKRTAEGQLSLTLVVGETSSKFRDTRKDAPKSKKLTMAKTCDGAFGARVIVGLLRASKVSLETVDFSAAVDEWPSLGNRLANSHLVVIGSPEVNICAAFLHGLVPDFHFGSKQWPIDLPSMGNMLFCAGRSYLRIPFDVCQIHLGGVFLLKNPWNPEYRLLWIGGVSGRGTGQGAALIANNWSELEIQAGNAIGVVYLVEMEGEEVTSRRFAWLENRDDQASWIGTLDEELSSPVRRRLSKCSRRQPIPNPGRNLIFISYSHKDKEPWLSDLETNLKPFEFGSKTWSDRMIPAGSEWHTEIKVATQRAKVAVLLVTPAFLASNYIREHELGPFLKEAEQGGVRILWIPIRHSVYLETDLKKYQALSDPSKPLADMRGAQRNKAWVRICEKIKVEMMS